MRVAGLVVGERLAMLHAATVPGGPPSNSTHSRESFIRDHGGRPSFAEVPGYRHTLCTSVNDRDRPRHPR